MAESPPIPGKHSNKFNISSPGSAKATYLNWLNWLVMAGGCSFCHVSSDCLQNAGIFWNMTRLWPKDKFKATKLTWRWAVAYQQAILCTSHQHRQHDIWTSWLGEASTKNGAWLTNNAILEHGNKLAGIGIRGWCFFAKLGLMFPDCLSHHTITNWLRTGNAYRVN